MVQSGLAEHTLASPGVGNAGQGAGLGLGSNNSAPNPGAARKERQWHRVPPPTSSALGDLTHCWSQDQTHGKTSYFSEANLGLAFCSQKKKKHLKKKSNKTWNLFQSKKRVNTGASAASKSPSTAEPQWYQHKQEQEAAHWGATALLFFGGNSKGLVSPSLEHPSWPRCHQPPPPCPSTTCSTTMCLSNEHHGCHTAERTGPRQSQSIPVHLWLTSSFHSVTVPQRVKKKKNQVVATFQIRSGI